MRPDIWRGPDGWMKARMIGGIVDVSKAPSMFGSTREPVLQARPWRKGAVDSMVTVSCVFFYGAAVGK